MFNSIWSIIVTRLETGSNQKHILEYKVGTGSDGNLVPENVFKNSFLKCNHDWTG